MYLSNVLPFIAFPDGGSLFFTHGMKHNTEGVGRLKRKKKGENKKRKECWKRREDMERRYEIQEIFMLCLGMISLAEH